MKVREFDPENMFGLSEETKARLPREQVESFNRLETECKRYAQEQATVVIDSLIKDTEFTREEKIKKLTGLIQFVFFQGLMTATEFKDGPPPANPQA